MGQSGSRFHLDTADDRELGEEWPGGDADAAVEVDVGHAHSHAQPLTDERADPQRHRQLRQRVYLRPKQHISDLDTYTPL